MIRKFAPIFSKTLRSSQLCFSTGPKDAKVDTEPSFLQMVESYFDKAARHTNIRPDILEFYKKPDNVIKLNLTLERGTY